MKKGLARLMSPAPGREGSLPFCLGVFSNRRPGPWRRCREAGRQVVWGDAAAWRG